MLHFLEVQTVRKETDVRGKMCRTQHCHVSWKCIGSFLLFQVSRAPQVDSVTAPRVPFSKNTGAGINAQATAESDSISTLFAQTLQICLCLFCIDMKGGFLHRGCVFVRYPIQHWGYRNMSPHLTFRITCSHSQCFPTSPWSHQLIL